MQIVFRITLSTSYKQINTYIKAGGRLSLPHTRENSLANCLARQFAQQFPLVCGGLYRTYFCRMRIDVLTQTLPVMRRSY